MHEVQLANYSEKQTGTLYDTEEVKRQQVFDHTNWLEVLIRVEGKEISCAIDGKVVMEFTERANPRRELPHEKRLLNPAGGAIALQANSPRGAILFKSIEIRELKSKDDQAR